MSAVHAELIALRVAGLSGAFGSSAVMRAFQPLFQLDGVEPEQVAPFEVRNAPFEHEPSDVPLVDVQLFGHLLEGEQPPSMGGAGGVSLVPDQADLLGHQGAPAI